MFVDAGAFRADKRFETQPSYYYDFAMQPTVEPRIEGRNSPPPSHPRRAGVGDRNRSALPLATRHVNTNDPMLAGRQEREEAEEREEETRDREVAAASAAAAAEYLRELAEAADRRAAEVARHATVPPGTVELVQAHAAAAPPAELAVEPGVEAVADTGTALAEPAAPPAGEEPCSICLGPYNNRVWTRCNHSFCHECIMGVRRTWFFDRVPCPLCRQDVNLRELTQPSVAAATEQLQVVNPPLAWHAELLGADDVAELLVARTLATNRNLQTNIQRREERLEGTEQLLYDSPLQRLALVLTLRDGAPFLLRWDGAVGWSSGEAALEINAGIHSDLVSALHVFDMRTFKSATIFSNIREVQEGYWDDDPYWGEDMEGNEVEIMLMMPDILRRRDEDEEVELDEEEEEEEEETGEYDCREVAEVCRMGLKLHLREAPNDKTIFLGATYCDNSQCLHDVSERIRMVNEDDEIAFRDIIVDAIEQS